MKERYDILFFTAIKEEFVSMKKILTRSSKGRQYNVNTNFCIEEYSYKQKSGKEIRMLLACPTKAGQLDSAILSTYLFSKYDFSYIAITGIAGSIFVNFRKNEKYQQKYLFHENMSLGDIIFADKIINVDISRVEKFESIKGLASFKRNSRAQKIEIERKLIDEFISFSNYRSNIFDEKVIIENYHEQGAHVEGSRDLPNIVVAPILSSNQLIADRDSAREIIRIVEHTYSKIHPLGFEMESFAVARAAQYLQPNASCFVIKAANDFADQFKARDEENWRDIALKNASLASFNFAQHLVDNKH